MSDPFENLEVLPRLERGRAFRTACAIAHGHCAGKSQAELVSLVLRDGLPSAAERARIVAEREAADGGGTTPPSSPPEE